MTLATISYGKTKEKKKSYEIRKLIKNIVILYNNDEDSDAV